MPIFTKDQFVKIANSSAGSKGIRGVVNEVKAFSRSSQTTSIFLSHCHTDKSIVDDAVAFLRSLNATIYVDWMDETMPEQTTGATASKIKSRIITNDKFILLATNAAIASKWCNWEIGLGDAYKLRDDKICLLPLADSSGRWEGNEYLQIYPFVETSSTYDTIFRLTYPDRKQVWFDDWLKKD